MLNIHLMKPNEASHASVKTGLSVDKDKIFTQQQKITRNNNLPTSSGKRPTESVCYRHESGAERPGSIGVKWGERCETKTHSLQPGLPLVVDDKPGV